MNNKVDIVDQLGLALSKLSFLGSAAAVDANYAMTSDKSELLDDIGAVEGLSLILHDIHGTVKEAYELILGELEADQIKGQQ